MDALPALHATASPHVRHGVAQPAVAAAAVLALLLGTFAVLVLPLAPPAAAAPVPRGVETSLGTAFGDKVLSPQAAHGTGSDGRSLTYFVTSGNDARPALFQAIDTLSGDVVFQQRVSAGIDSWGITVSGKTAVFTVNDGAAHLYSWTPGNSSLRSLGAPFGSDSVWALTTAPDGTVYAGSYPTGRLWEIDAGTGRTRAIGTPNPGEAYLRALAADDRYVYAGSMGKGKLARVDRSTLAATPITLPAPASGTNNGLTELELRGKYLIAVSSSSSSMFLYDTTKGTFANTVEIDAAGNALPARSSISGVNTAVSPVNPTKNAIYFQRSNFGLGELDLNTLRYARTGYSTQLSPRDMAWVNTGLAGWASPSLVVAGAPGTEWAYDVSVKNFQSRPGRSVDLQPDTVGAPGEIRSLGAGPDGKVYIGGYQNPTGVRIFDPATNRFEEIESLPQVERFGSFGSRVLMGGYPRAQLLAYDPARPVNFTGAAGAFSQNPNLHQLASSQERPFDFLDLGDGTVAVASVSAKSTVGGAFTVWKPSTTTTRLYRDPIPRQSVVALTRTQGVVVAGSSINGGTGYEATELLAKLFTIDPATGKVLSSLTPSDQGRVAWVNALSIDPRDQTIWGIAGRSLFHAKVDGNGKLTLLKSKKIFDNNPGFYGNDFSTFVRDGIVYANSDGNLYAIDAQTFEKTTLATGGIRDLVVIGDRDLYYTKNDLELFRYRLPAQSARPTFIDVRPGVEHYDAMMWMHDSGLSTGWATGKGPEYRALNSVNRDAMAAFLYRQAGSPAVTLPKTSPFTDMRPGQEHYKAVIWAYQQGITTGWKMGNGTRQFRPVQPIARDAMAAFLYRFAGKPAYTAPSRACFSDVSGGRMYAREMCWMKSSGVSTGWADGTYRPLQPVKRDAMAAFLQRFNATF
jgi:hypothetical protein